MFNFLNGKRATYDSSFHFKGSHLEFYPLQTTSLQPRDYSSLGSHNFLETHSPAAYRSRFIADCYNYRENLSFQHLSSSIVSLFLPHSEKPCDFRDNVHACWLFGLRVCPVIRLLLPSKSRQKLSACLMKLVVPPAHAFGCFEKNSEETKGKKRDVNGTFDQKRPDSLVNIAEFHLFPQSRFDFAEYLPLVAD